MKIWSLVAWTLNLPRRRWNDLRIGSWFWTIGLKLPMFPCHIMFLYQKYEFWAFVIKFWASNTNLEIPEFEISARARKVSLERKTQAPRSFTEIYTVARAANLELKRTMFCKTHRLSEECLARAYNSCNQYFYRVLQTARATTATLERSALFHKFLKRRFMFQLPFSFISEYS